MLSRKYRRIYHYHLKKCGGTTLNRWLDTLTFDERAFNGFFGGVQGVDPHLDEGRPDIVRQNSRPLFYWSDVIYDHRPIRMYAPQGTFCFTVLRDPVQRILSQVSDWRHLQDADTADSGAAVREYVEDSRRLPLLDFLEKHAERSVRDALDNYLTRALAAGRIGDLVDEAVDAERLCDIALQSLEEDYDLIGLTEVQDLSRNALCAMIGHPPARTIPRCNVTRPAEQANQDFCDAGEILQRLTRVDYVVYARAVQLFDQRHRRVAQAYNTAAFESNHAAALLAEARGIFRDGATCYSVRMPLVGSGFQGRDGSGLAECAVWSGPETRATLYVPTPSGMRLSLLVWIRGYVDGRQRDQLRVLVDGVPVAHRFEWADGYADVLTVDVVSTRDFVRLEIELDETLESGEPGSELYDSRARGFAFDSYGWRPI